jgi:RNA polymerase sigma factor (TIGR02999 family)
VSDITHFLSAIDQGDPHAVEQLLPFVYAELRIMAAERMAAERPDHTLNPTALVHEAYLRLIGNQQFKNRGHFFAAAAEAMRRILVENARRKRRIKHGGGRRRQVPDLEQFPDRNSDDELLDLHDALEQFAVHDPIKAKLVELRFFGGLTLEQAATFLNISLSTADRAWRYARAWLYAAMSGDNSEKKMTAA